MITLNQRIILDERVITEKEEGIHHEIYQTIGPVWAHIAFKRGHDSNGSSHQPCVYSFTVRKSDRLAACTLGRLHWKDKTLYITHICISEKHPQYLTGYCANLTSN